MKFTSVAAFVLLSTIASTMARPIDKRAASPEVQAANAQDAIALNKKFATLKATDACNNGDKACVNGGFAQCNGGKWEITQCGGGTTCCALPLVNSRGTSITCDTPADRDQRIKTAQGNSGGAAPPASTPTASPTASPPASSTPTTPPANSGSKSSTGSSDSGTGSNGSDIASIRKQNAIDAQNLENQFKSLTPNSPCTSGQNACINGQFAQCNGNKFAVTPCAGSSSSAADPVQCFVLPLVNKKGTSVTCDTKSDRDKRFETAQNGQS